MFLLRVLLDWFTGLFLFFVIGQSDYFDFGLTTLARNRSINELITDLDWGNKIEE